MLLYHTGFQKIRDPDIHYGRKNADFGQGFYMTDKKEFACRWAREQRGRQTILNTYELNTDGLQICSFARDINWFEYIFANRAGKPDTHPEADLIIGPIANDTIYDTFGIITSGLLEKEQSMQLLMIGPVYEQIVLKSEKAAHQLHWLESRVLQPEEIGKYRTLVAEEEAEYQKQFAAVLEKL